jgi:Fe-S-cluster containining protein
MTTIIDRVFARENRPQTQLLAEFCSTCPGHCCRNDTILLHPEKGDIPSLYDTETISHPMTGKPAKMLAHKPNGDCIYLGEVDGVGRCTIYHRRPAICRAFDCGLSYAKLTRAERRQLLRDDLVSRDTLDQGRRVQEARASRIAQDAD